MNIVGVYWECPFCTTYIYIVFIHGRFFLPENGGFQFMAMFIGKLVKSHTFFGGINSSQ